MMGCGRLLTLQEKVLPLLPLLLLLTAPPAASSAEAPAVVEKPCAAHWSVLGSQRNWPGAGEGGQGLQVRLGYSSGPREPQQPASGSEGPKDPMTLLALTVRLTAAGAGDRGDDDPTVQLRGPELTSPVERSLTVTVPERGAVTVWQLVVTVADRRFGLESTAVTSGSLQQPLTRVVGCSASFRMRRLIRDDTPVRLRHAATGRYLGMTRKRGWEAAALGHSREFRFRLRGVGMSGGSVRIEAETHLYGGYKFASASLLGGVYFYTWKLDSESQQWTLSDPYPRDGDAVTVRSVRWPSAALVQHRGGKTGSVRCLNAQNPDMWTVEVA